MNANDRLRADFHTHTGHSDGHGTMEQLLAAAEAKRLDAIAVTDHDVLDGARWAYAWKRHQDRLAAAGKATGIIVIPGVEISAFMTRDGRPDVVHMVLLGVDPFEASLSALCDDLADRRMTMLHRRLDYARNVGYGLGHEAEGRVLSKAFWGKQEIARELVLRGDFEDVDSAYHALWDEYDPASDMGSYVPADVAIETAHASGGIAVLGHPLRDERRRRLLSVDDAEERIGALQDMGVDGVECFYRAFSPSDCQRLEEIARSRGLVVSCGSDHHDFGQRFRLSVTCADGRNYGHRTNVLDALGIKIGS